MKAQAQSTRKKKNYDACPSRAATPSVSIRLDASVLEMVSQEAKETNTSLASVIKKYFHIGLDNAGQFVNRGAN